MVDDIQKRIDKFKRRAPHIRNHVHLSKIIESFPLEHRDRAMEQARPQIKPEILKEWISKALSALPIAP